MIPSARRGLAALLLALALGCLSAPRTAAQQVALKANVLSWALATPDLGMDIVTGEHTSLGISVFGHWKPYGIDSKMWALQGEFRYWFNGRPLTREYVGLCAFGAAYDMEVNDRIYKGNALALGLSGGYSWALGDRWNLDVSAGTGLLVFRQKYSMSGDRYDDYYMEKVSGANAMGLKFFPVKLSIAFVYILK